MDETDGFAVVMRVEPTDAVCRIDADPSGVIDGNRESVGEGELNVMVEGVNLRVTVVVPVAICVSVVAVFFDVLFDHFFAVLFRRPLHEMSL